MNNPQPRTMKTIEQLQVKLLEKAILKLIEARNGISTANHMEEVSNICYVQGLLEGMLNMTRRRMKKTHTDDIRTLVIDPPEPYFYE